MASKVLKSFLIGIGYDTKMLDQGDKKINASLNGIKSGALGISTAIVGAFGFASASVVGVANRVDQLALATQNLRTPMSMVYNFGNVVEAMGGQASEALDALSRFEEFQNNIRLNGTDGSIENLARSGIDVLSLTGTRTGEEFMRALAEMMPRLDEGQRAQVQSTLGLSDGVLKSLRGGVEQLDQSLSRASALTGSIDQLTDDARRLAENSKEFGFIIEGIKNNLAKEFLPSLVGAGTALNGFLKEYRGEIGSAIGYAGDNAGATAAIGGSSVAALGGAAAAKLGLKTLGGAASRAGVAGLAVSGGAVGSNLLNSTLNEYVPGYGDASRGFDNWIKGVTGLERIPSPLDMFGGRTAEDAMPPDATSSRDDYIQASAEAIGGVISRSPLKVESKLGVTLQIDGRALESKIMEVNERQNFDTLGDLKTTTER